MTTCRVKVSKPNVVVELNTATSYSRGHGLDSRPWRQAMLVEISRGFLQSLQANAGVIS
jgi:hypothetical protein